MLHESAGASNIGNVRKNNEDYYSSAKTINGEVFIVCDGMGGHAGGEIASMIAAQQVIAYFNLRAYPNMIIALNDAIKHANNEVFKESGKNPNLRGMGSTITVVLINSDEVFIAHVGDSRIYLLSNSELFRLTEDHSFVQQLVNNGEITDEESEKHPKKNQLTRALGIAENVEVTICKKPLQLKKNDTLLLCSDGLTGMVNDLTIQQILLSNNINVEAKVNELISLANNAGGVDNTTVCVIRINDSKYNSSQFEDFSPVGYLRTNGKKNKYSLTKISISLTILVVAIGFVLFYLSNICSPKTKFLLKYDVASIIDENKFDDKDAAYKDYDSINKIIIDSSGWVKLYKETFVCYIFRTGETLLDSNSFNNNKIVTRKIVLTETKTDSINENPEIKSKEKDKQSPKKIIEKDSILIHTITSNDHPISRVAKKYGLCTCLVLDAANAVKGERAWGYDKKGEYHYLVKGKQIKLPISYSSKKEYNPDHYKEFTVDKQLEKCTKKFKK